MIKQNQPAINKFWLYGLLWMGVIHNDGICQGLISPGDSLYLVQKFALNARSVEADLQNNIYIITTFNELLKLDNTGKLLRRYSNNYLGQVQLISINNPLQIVLFYPGFQTLIILDNTLNEIKRISMEQLNIPYVTTIGYSPEREIWYFDEQLKRFKKVNINGRLILETNMDQAYVPSRIQKIRAQKNEIKIRCDSLVIITLDVNGNYKGKINQEGDWIYWKENVLGFFQNQKLILREENSAEATIQNLPTVLSSLVDLSFMAEGYVGIDQESRIYIYKSKVKP